MDSGGTATRFRTTCWTLIVGARSSPADLEELLRRYWSPVYAYLRRSGWSREEAEDITQDFLSEVLLGRDLVGKADPERGRFRSFLLTALQHFAVDARRRTGDVRNPDRKRVLPDDPDELANAEPRETHDPGAAFERQWATTVFDQALKLTEESCREAFMTRQWRAFEARVQRPLLHGCDPMPIPILLDELKVRDPQEIYDMVQTVKRKLRHALRDVVAETVANPNEVDDELQELRRSLST